MTPGELLRKRLLEPGSVSDEEMAQAIKNALPSASSVTVGTATITNDDSMEEQP